MKSETEAKERVFSIELSSRSHFKNVTLANGSSDNVLVEGTLGELVGASFVEDVILEIIGKKGILRINLEAKDITKTKEQNNLEVANR